MEAQRTAPAAIGEVKAGDTFEVVRTCDRYRPIYYAAASGDFNPIHIDDEVGRKAGLGGVILQGMCTMAWMVEAAVSFAGDPTRVRKARCRFSRPVLVGDSITYRGRVASVDSGAATVEIAAVNQRGEEVLKGGLVEIRLD